jgi:hypothetical protein
MKHETIDGKLINLDKTWRHLSVKQRDWIVSQFREEYVSHLNKNGTHPNKEECRELIDRVYEKIQERGIWIPYREVQKAFSAKLQRYRKLEVAAKE